MSDEFRFFVAGEPIAQPRPKFRRFKNFVGTYTPDKLVGPWKHRCTLAARESRVAGLRMEGPIVLSLVFVLPRPLSHFGTGKNAGKLKTGAPRFHIIKPDFDNLAKAVCDAFTDAAVWLDDSQVVSGASGKGYAAPGERTGCHVVISRPEVER